MSKFNLAIYAEWLVGALSTSAILAGLVVSITALILNDISVLQGY